MYIKDLLNKIKWDKRENPTEYKLLYYDRILDKLLEIPYNAIIELNGQFMKVNINGEPTHIPLHRIKQVKKKGITVWQRN